MTFFIGEKIRPWNTAGMCARCAAWFLLIASACCVQAIESPGSAPAVSRVHPVAKAAHPSNTTARPAAVSLKDGKLTIDANDSDLGQILRGVAAASGMTIDGLAQSARVFGTYGPGNPRDVLSELLAGSGYNFMMAGDTPGGAPRELLLTGKNDSAPAPPANPEKHAAPAAPSSPEMDVPDPPGPGYVAHVPPSERQTPDDDNSQEDNDRVQNNLQRLEQIHSSMGQQGDPQ